MNFNRAPAYGAYSANVAFQSGTLGAKAREIVSVKDFGAVGDGVTDDTAAFKAACKSTTPMSVAIAQRGIYVPPGKYRITDTVYVRAGNVLYGDGMSSFIDASGFPAEGTRPVFKLGYGQIAGVDVIDNTAPGVGDLPPHIHSLFVLGGPGAAAVVHLAFPGGFAHHLWLSAPGVGVHLAGGLLFSTQIDGGLVGVVLGASNQTIDNVQFFNPNYCITVDGVGSDSVISNCKFEYPKYEAISVNAAGTKGLKVSSSNFFQNEQYASTVGMIVCRNAGQEVHVSGCQFSNHKGFAVNVSGGAKVWVTGCVFRGDKTVNDYTQSTTAAGIALTSGTVVAQGCTFERLRGYALQVGSGDGTAHAEMSACVINGTQTVTHDCEINSTATGDTLTLSQVSGSGKNLFNINAYTYPTTSGLTNWLQVNDNGTRSYIEIPALYGVLIDFNLFANMHPPGDSRYRKNKRLLVDVYTEYQGGAYKTFLQASTLIASPAVEFAELDVVAELQAVGAGTTVTPPHVGYVVIHWPNTYTLSRPVSAEIR